MAVYFVDSSAVVKRYISEIGDVHLGWKQFQQIADPACVLADQQKTEEFNRRYGAGIRSLCGEKGLKQSDIPGVTARNLRHREHDDQAAVALGMAVLSSREDAKGFQPSNEPRRACTH